MATERVTSVWSHEVEYGSSRELASATTNSSVPPAATVTGPLGLMLALALPLAPGTGVAPLNRLQAVPLHRSPCPGSLTEPETVTVWAVLNGERHPKATDFPFAGTICSDEAVPPAGTAIQVVGVEGLSVQPASAPPLKLLE
jgi:hypothetical protein